MTEPFMTFEKCAQVLGSTDRPLSRQTVVALVERGELQDNGMPHKARRILTASVTAYIARLEAGICQENQNQRDMEMVASTPIRSGQGTSSSRYRSQAGQRASGGRLTAKTLKQSTRR